ncbi:MAG: hypothetical protein GX366_05115 [Epulopiscium sp.]|nr:hypothetical protein [Candidatus Epulonipiscium sp.]
MSNEKLTIDFINSLLHKTLSNKIHWGYLDEESEYQLAYNLDLTELAFNAFDIESSKESPIFDIDNSFYFTSKEQNMNVVLYTDLEDGYLHLIVVPFTYRNKLTIDSPQYISALTQLLNAIKKQFPNPYDFMDEFIKE